MESDQFLRLEALRLAVSSFGGTLTPSELITTAKKLEDFIKGPQVEPKAEPAID